MFSTMIATAMEVVAALVETKAMKTDAAAAAAPTPAPSAEVVLCEKGDGECLIAVAFGPLAAEEEEKEEDDDRECLIAVAFGPLAVEETTQDEEDQCLVVEAFGPLVAEEAAQDEDDDSSATTAGKLIVEAFDTFVDAPAPAAAIATATATATAPSPAAGPSLSARLMEVALALVKQYVTDCAIAVAVPMAKWAAWYAVLWVKEYAKLTLELEMKREAAAERMKKTAHRAVRQW